MSMKIKKIIVVITKYYYIPRRGIFREKRGWLIPSSTNSIFSKGRVTNESMEIKERIIGIETIFK